MLGKIFTLILGVAVGTLILIYHRILVRTVGTNAWAERVFGGGGTYTMWQLIGLIIVVGTVLYISGALDRIFMSFARFLGF